MTNAVNYYERGLDVVQTVGWSKTRSNAPVNNPFLDQAFWNHTIENCWGRVWGRPGLAMRDRQIATMAVLVSIGSDWGIENHLRYCHNVGLTELAVRELIMMAGYYSGWPHFAAINRKFNEILAEPSCNWPADRRMQLPEPGAPPEATDANAYEKGLQRLVDLGWAEAPTSVPPLDAESVDQRFWNHTIENLFGRIYGRPGISLRDRQIIVIATLISAHTQRELAHHLEHCHTAGLSEEEVRELIMQVGYYTGWPKFAAATVTFNKVLAEPGTTWPAEKRMVLPARGERPKGIPATSCGVVAGA